ncbi:MAG: hypothetical protein AAF433_08170 [Bacteroidota bacterium]
MSPLDQFHVLARNIDGVQAGQMFGWNGYKLNRKFFIYFQASPPKGQEETASCAMVFRLSSADATLAFSLQGAVPFDPAGGRPMKNWAVLPDTLQEHWPEFVELAAHYVQTL